jgi:FkbM family methyltransferase
MSECREFHDGNQANDARLDVKLNPESRVWDIGGFRGDYAERFCKRFGCAVDVFEPVPAFAKAAAERLRDYQFARVFDFGLWDKTCTVPMFINEDRSSLMNVGTEGTLVQLVELQEAVALLNASTIDLVEMNIEGAEDVLIPHAASTGIIRNWLKINIQFHEEESYPRLRDILLRTHHPVWMHGLAWQSWELNT